jgi:hypothetical protein
VFFLVLGWSFTDGIPIFHHPPNTLEESIRVSGGIDIVVRLQQSTA